MKTEKDLVWLVWNGPGYFPTLEEEAPNDVAVDITNRTWTFRGQTIKFGQAVEHPWGEKDTPLGVYDRMNVDHLRMMLSAYRRLAPPLTVSIHPHRD